MDEMSGTEAEAGGDSSEMIFNHRSEAVWSSEGRTLRAEGRARSCVIK